VFDGFLGFFGICGVPEDPTNGSISRWSGSNVFQTNTV
jgi:hypothetical protein